MSPGEKLTVGLAQIAPVWLNRQATIEKVAETIEEAAAQNCSLVVFGEALVPGYPFWVERTEGARFNSDLQKEWFARYSREAVCIEDGDLDGLRSLAKARGIAVYLGTIERPRNRTGHSLYATLVFIDLTGEIRSAHRKLMPTHEERLVWSPGDGHGLRTHRLGPFTVGGLNCWENWMPLSRAALYGQCEDLHVAVWPGCVRNTVDITRFIALESRSFVLSVSGLMRREDIPDDVPDYEGVVRDFEDMPADGGSCIASPDGQWLIEPVQGEERLVIAELDHALVRKERQNFDPAGHYSRPDVVSLKVDRKRQTTVAIDD